jgi:hypothetical protein
MGQVWAQSGRGPKRRGLGIQAFRSARWFYFEDGEVKTKLFEIKTLNDVYRANSLILKLYVGMVPA